MSKRRDPLTKDLFEWTPPQVAIRYEEGVTGRGPLDNRISRLIARALRDARDDGFQRSEIASAMSKYLGRTISTAMLDKWASEGSGEHRIPLVQFEDGAEVPGLAQLVPALSPDVTPVEFVRWFTLPSTELGDADAKHHPSPREWLLATGDARPVLRLVAAL